MTVPHTTSFDSTVLVLGATGTVGSALCRALQEQGQRVRAATRQPRPIPPTSVEDVYFDLERAETFEAALQNVDRVFMIARPGDDNPDRLALPFIQAVQRHPIKHLVHLGAMGIDTLPDHPLRRVELAIEQAGIPYTFLRPNFFFQIFSTPPLQLGIKKARRIAVPAGVAQLSFIDARDIAAVAATLLSTSKHLGEAFTLTGNSAIDHAQVASAIGEALGEPVHYEALDEASAYQGIVASGLSEARAQRLLGFYRLVRAGFCAPVSDAVERILGRPAIEIERFAQDHVEAW
ncbi:MAG: NmrA family NAD(P)-binding protein [Myxococcota bacterium]|jgi:uncharacterized protein YbjT (DUF2867 family)|nr:NmrA family NAD(P)-binding protein [Myxococcota bacterium]